MSDDKKQTDRPNDIRVDSNDAVEVQSLHSEFPGKTIEQIKGAMRSKGPWRKDIVSYLEEDLDREVSGDNL